MNIRGSKVVVTGADGFIGSHLTERLVSEGAEVSAFVLYNSFDSCGWLDSLPSATRNEIRIIRGDIRDSHLVIQAMKHCEICFHLAALISIPFSYVAPSSYVETNIIGTLNVLSAAQAAGAYRVIHTSTSEVYGSAQFVPISEEHPLNAQSPYAASKIGADQMALALHRSFNLPVVVVRPFNTYGPRQSTRAIIPAIITQLLGGNNAISLGSLHPTRDLSFVRDTVAGFLAAAVAENVEGGVFNLGSEFEISIGELAQLIAQVMNRSIDIITAEERLRPEQSEVTRLLAATQRAKDLLGWTPTFNGRAGLERGLRETVEWFSVPANLERYQLGRFAI